MPQKAAFCHPYDEKSGLTHRLSGGQLPARVLNRAVPARVRSTLAVTAFRWRSRHSDYARPHPCGRGSVSARSLQATFSRTRTYRQVVSGPVWLDMTVVFLVDAGGAVVGIKGWISRASCGACAPRGFRTKVSASLYPRATIRRGSVAQRLYPRLGRLSVNSIGPWASLSSPRHLCPADTTVTSKRELISLNFQSAGL